MATFPHVWRAVVFCIWMVNADLQAPTGWAELPAQSWHLPQELFVRSTVSWQLPEPVGAVLLSPLFWEVKYWSLLSKVSCVHPAGDCTEEIYSLRLKSWVRAIEGQRSTETEGSSSPNLGVKCRQVKVQLWAFSMVVCTGVPSLHKHIYCATFMFSNHLLMKQQPVFHSSISRYEVFFLILVVLLGTAYTKYLLWLKSSGILVLCLHQQVAPCNRSWFAGWSSLC